MIKKCKYCDIDFIPIFRADIYCPKHRKKDNRKIRVYKLKGKGWVNPVAIVAKKVVNEIKQIESKIKKPRDEKALDRHYRLKYGITIEDYRRMAIEQDNRCAICGAIGRLLVDHDHITGKVRGLLCTSCNTGLGLFKDSMGAINSASAYLIRHKKV